MRISHLDDMKGGWFIGDFEPNCLRTEGFEVAIKHYRVGDTEPAHFHRLPTEVTLLLSGKAKLVLLCHIAKTV